MPEDIRQLIRQVAAHDQAAGRAFVHEYDERIKYWVYQRADFEKVEEYAQEVWGHLIQGNWMRLLQWKGLYSDEDYNPHSLDAYLKRITFNKVMDLQAKEPPRLPDGVDPSDIIDRTTSLGPDPVAEAERSRLMKIFDRCTAWYKRKDHDAIRLWWEGHSAQHIADLFKTNPNNVYQRRSYLFKRLRECLVENMPEYFRDV